MRRGSGCWQSLQANSCAYLVRACGTEELQLCEVPLRSYVGLRNHNVSVPPDGRDCSEGKQWFWISDFDSRLEAFFPFVNIIVASFSTIPWNVHETRGLFFFSNCSWLLIAVWPCAPLSSPFILARRRPWAVDLLAYLWWSLWWNAGKGALHIFFNHSFIFFLVSCAIYESRSS